MSFVRPGDDDTGGEGYVTTNTPGQTIGKLLGLTGNKAEGAASTTQEKLQGKSASSTHEHHESHTAESKSSAKNSKGQIVAQQSGADKWDQAAEETLAARNAAGKINTSKSELEESSRKASELHDLAIERANAAMASAEQLQNLEDRAAAKDAAVKKLLSDLKQAKEEANRIKAAAEAAESNAAKAAQFSRSANKDLERFPAKLEDKRNKAAELQSQIEDLTNQLNGLRTEIKRDETESVQLKQRAEGAREQVQAKSAAKENASRNVEASQAQVDRIEQHLGQQEKEKDAAIKAAGGLEGKAHKQSEASQKVEAKVSKAEAELKAKTESVKAQESAAQEHWERAKKLGDSADVETKAAERDAIAKAERTTTKVDSSSKTEEASAKLESVKKANV